MKLGFSIKICIENVFDLRTLETINRCEAWTSSEENSFIHLGLEKCSELLSQDETINSGKYCNQFDKLKDSQKTAKIDEPTKLSQQNNI